MLQTLTHPDRRVSFPAPPVPAFRCTLGDCGMDVAWLRIVGELDIATSPLLARTLERVEDRVRRIVLDLRELTFIDAFSVHVILDATTLARRAGRRLLLVRGPSHIDRVLELTGACEWLEIVDLRPAEPPVQALVQLARRERARRVPLHPRVGSTDRLEILEADTAAVSSDPWRSPLP